MVHLFPLPGTPYYQPGDLQRSVDKARRDCAALCAGGADGCVIQTNDRVYTLGNEVDPARLVSYTTIVQEVAREAPPNFKIGVQILWNALQASLAVAQFCGGSFIRTAVFVGATDSPAGIAKADPVGFEAYREKIGANGIKVVAEVQGMHYHNVDGKGVGEIAQEALQAGANAVEVADPDEQINEQLVLCIKEMKSNLPVFLGGHTNHENVVRRMRFCDGVFVGSCFENEGWGGYVDPEKVRSYVGRLKSAYS